jgi:hypothetical protein
MARIDLKFDEEFVEKMWAGEKTQTMRRSVKGAIGDIFFIDYPEKEVTMKFEISGITQLPYITPAVCTEMYSAEGFYSPAEMQAYLKEKGYVGPVYIHTFRLIGQYGLKILDFTMGVKTTVINIPQTDMSIRTEIPEEMRVKLPVTYPFEVALNRVKAGMRQQRKGWNGKGMYIEMQVPDEHSKMSLPYIYMSTAQGDLVPWLASQTDLLSEDWCNYEEK